MYKRQTPYITNVTADYVTSPAGVKELLRLQVSSSCLLYTSVYRMVNALGELGVFQTHTPYRLDPFLQEPKNGFRVILKNQKEVEFTGDEWRKLLTDALQKKGYAEAPEIERVVLNK